MERKIIDFRNRPPFGDFLKGDMYGGYALEYNAYWGDKPAKPLLDKSMDSMIEEMNNGGIHYGVAASRPWAGVSNECVCDLVKQYPDYFIAIAAINGINPYFYGTEDAINVIKEFVLDGPCKGLCLEPGFVPDVKYSWRADDKNLYPIYEFCQKNGVMINFTWGNIGAKNYIEVYKPEYIDKIAADFPELVMVLSHAGWPYIMEHLGIGIARKNVYLGVDDVLVPHFPGYEMFISAINRALKYKMIWGTCFPIGQGLKEAVQTVNDMGVEPDAFPWLMWKNAEKVLKLN